MSIVLRRAYRFSASHRYFREEWSDERNTSTFGRCARAPGHGHNYRMTIWVAGEPDPLTGFAVDLVALDELVRARVLDLVDHRHLNDALPEFGQGGAIPTTENLARWAASRLEDEIPGAAVLRRVRIAEDDDLAAEWLAGSDERA